MHARLLVEVAALAATQGPGLIAGRAALSAAGLEQYWTSSKCRLDRWYRTLGEFTADALAGRSDRQRWRALRPVVEEVFTGELLSRVWGAVLQGYDRRRGQAEAEPIARSVLIGHLEARHRALTLLVCGPGVGTEEAVALNRLRRRSERWTDLLLGHLAEWCDVGGLAFDADRAAEFASDLRRQRRQPAGYHAWALTVASLRGAFQTDLDDETANPDLNSRIAAAVVASFPAEQFDATGVFRGVWLARLANTACDAQGMLDDLLAVEPRRRPASGPGESTGASAPWRRFRG